MAVRQCLHDALGRNACGLEAAQRHVQAAFLRIARTFVNGTAANVVAVFRQVGQVAEVSERANHADRGFCAERGQEFFQCFVSIGIRVTTKRHREFAHLFDQLIGFFAFLFANHIAQDAA
mgnify:CR=1 FL=1